MRVPDCSKTNYGCLASGALITAVNKKRIAVSPNPAVLL